MLVVDLSNNNAQPDFRALKRSGVDAVWLKATEGAFFTDPDFQRWRKQANAAGLRVGAYHFARPDKNPYSAVADAGAFSRAVATIDRTDLRPVLDYERTTGVGGDDAWIREFNKIVVNRLKVGPLFYTYPGFVPGLRLRGTVGWGLWLASYGRDDGKEYPFQVPAPWKKAVAHQFTSNARMSGCSGPVDLTRVFNRAAVLAHPVTGWL